ncbi:Son of sevenless 1 [Balamuthia mandrillaris]
MEGGTPSRALALKKHMNAELMATMQARALAGSSGSVSFSTPPNRAPPTSSGPTHHTGTSSAFRAGVPHLNTAPKDFVAGQVYPEGGNMGPAFSSGGHRDTRPSSGRTISAQQESSEESLVVGTPGGSMIEFRSLPSHNKDPYQHHHHSSSEGAANNNNKGSWSLRLPPAPTMPEASTSTDSSSPVDCNNDSEARVLPDEVRPRSTMTTMLPSVLPGLHHGTRPVPPGKVNRRSSTITTPDAIHAANSLFEVEAATAAADQANIFDERDSESNILFTNDTNEGGSGDKQVIKGATIVKLVERLTFPAYPDPDFMIAFLMTYRSFTTATELFRLLMLRYNMPPPPNIAGEELEKWHKAVRTPVRLRVVNVLKAWLQGHVYDFAENSTLMETFKHFTCSVMRLGGDLAMAKAGAQLERIMERELEGKKKEKEFVFDHPPPASILTIAINPSGRSLSVDYNDLKFMDLHPLEIARQLTLIEFDLYQSIKPWECLNQAWTKADRLEKAPNIISMIERFNQVSNWVVTELVSETDETSRVNVLKRFIELANECKQINNFNACMEIISGLTNSSIYRLKTTWAALPTRTHELFESLHELMSRERNYQNFRAHLHTVDPPCIPYLGVYLTDLTFIEDGNQDLIPGSSLVNFVKRRKVASVIREIQQYQQTPYNFACVTFIQDFLQNLRQMSSDEAYNRSLAIIPRGASSKLTSKQLRESKARYKKKLKSEESKKDVKSFLKHREDSGHHGDHSPAPSSPSATACSSSSSNDLLGHNFDNLELEHQDGYRFYAKDEPGKNIVLEETATNRPVIKAGTLEKLVERLTYAKYPGCVFHTCAQPAVL